MHININWYKGYPLFHSPYINKTAFVMGLVSALSSSTIFAAPSVWTQPVVGGEMLFYDWGYSGPQGQNAGEWVSNGTFDGPGQIQHVVTRDTDRLTPDASQLIKTDLDTTPLFRDANMDTQVNFYQWGYTTTGGSTFSNMQIDADGDYLIKREDMVFNYYNTFDYQYEGATPIGDLVLNAAEGISDTNIQFQPYALSDATGWCGSITASNPGALEAMAGQVTFDFGFEAFMPAAPHDGNGIGIPGYGSMQIVQDFEMRSYGSLQIVISVANGGQGDFDFNADAVVNNTHPTAATGTGTMISVPVLNMDGSPALDEFNQPRTMMVEDKTVGGGGVDAGYYNLVSFMGGGTVPAGAWVKLVDPAGPMSNDNIIEVLDADDGQPNTVWHQNSFAGYPFLLRADGIRVIEAVNYTLYSDLSNVPTVSGGVAYNNDESAVSQPIADISETPDAFAFTDQTDVELSTLTSSNTITVTGLTRGALVKVTGGEYSINGGAFASTNGIIFNNDTIQVRATSSDTVSTTVNVTLDIGTVSDVFSLTTRPLDTTPDVFSFTDQADVNLNTDVISNSISVTGIEIDVAISITGGLYSVNGGSYTLSAGTVSNADTVTVKVTSSSAGSTTTSATLTVGGVSDTFSVTTAVDSDGDGYIDAADNCPAVANDQIDSDGDGIGDACDYYPGSTDGDGDGVEDYMDNCILIANADQTDTDGDGYGNACDADFNNDGIVNALDTGTFKAEFFTAGSGSTDLNVDGIVNSIDLGIYKQQFAVSEPGPSALNP